MEQATRRPGWVWPISGFFLAASIAISLSFILALAHTIPVTAAQQDYLDNLTPLDFMIIGSVMTCNLLGAVLLVLLRGFAVPLFVVGWTFGVAQLLWHIAGKGWIAAAGSTGVSGFAAANLLSLVIIGYAVHLSRRGILR